MNTVFADTSYWIALANVQDEAHEIASAFSNSLKSCPILTTEPVLVEYLNYFAGWGPHFRRAAAWSVRAILTSQTVRVVRHTDESFLGGLDLYSARLDKGYSLTDCISMRGHAAGRAFRRANKGSSFRARRIPCIVPAFLKVSV